MAIGHLESDFEEKIISAEALNWSDIRLCELGNMERKVEPKMIAKNYYNSVLGIKEHVSIDINGKWGALPLNLDSPIPSRLKNRFNIVTNYGTGEHVGNQYSFFRNAHELCMNDGIIIHALVPIDHWPNHCRYYYDEKFVDDLAKICSYEILEVNRQAKYSEKPKSELIMVAYKKRENQGFVDEEKFKSIDIFDTGSDARTGNYTQRNHSPAEKDDKQLLYILASKMKRGLLAPVRKVRQTAVTVNKIFSAGIKVTHPQRKLQEIIGQSSICRSTLSASERVFLFDEAISHIQGGKVLEVGSYMGASAIVLAEALQQKTNPSDEPKIYCVDTWKNDAMTEGRRNTYQDFIDNTKSWATLIEPVVGDSRDVVLPYAGLFDVVFIDGDHSYEGCRRDVTRFAPLVREGGCLILDDHISYTGVTKVVGELLSSGEWYVGASHLNTISLYHDQKSLSEVKRLRKGNRSL